MKFISLTQTAAIALTLTIMTPFLRASTPIEIGSPAPAVTAKDQDGNIFQLADAAAQGTLLVYFYPKADTPGCTAQACSLRDEIEDLKEIGISVVGVSRDTPEAQKKFQEKYELPFPLLADKDGEVAKAFGVGSLLGFSNRSSFLIRDGKIVWFTKKAQTGRHAKEVMAAVAALEK